MLAVSGLSSMFGFLGLGMKKPAPNTGTGLKSGVLLP
jgi:hypothetical protein